MRGAVLAWLVAGCSVVVGIPDRRADDCAGHMLCDTFEGPLGEKWDVTTPAVSLTRDGRAGGGLLVSTNADPAFLEKAFDPTPASLQLAFDVRADLLPPGDVTFLARIAVGSGQYVAVYATPGKLVVQEMVFRGAAETVDHVASQPIPADRWARLSLDVAFAPARATLRLDDAVVVSAALASDFNARPPTLRLGVAYFNAAFDRRLRFDNVTFDVR